MQEKIVRIPIYTHINILLLNDTNQEPSSNETSNYYTDIPHYYGKNQTDTLRKHDLLKNTICQFCRVDLS